MRTLEQARTLLRMRGAAHLADVEIDGLPVSDHHAWLCSADTADINLWVDMVLSEDMPDGADLGAAFQQIFGGAL